VLEAFAREKVLCGARARFAVAAENHRVRACAPDPQRLVQHHDRDFVSLAHARGHHRKHMRLVREVEMLERLVHEENRRLLRE
jgi:hypothetical protein